MAKTDKKEPSKKNTTPSEEKKPWKLKKQYKTSQKSPPQSSPQKIVSHIIYQTNVLQH